MRYVGGWSSIIALLCFSSVGVALKAPPTPAVLSFSDQNFNYGQVTTGTTSDHTFVLTNSGQSMATLTTISSPSTPFTYKGGKYPGSGGNCGKSLNGRNRTCRIVVTFSPTSAATYSSSITINYNDGYQAQSLSLSFSGSGKSTATLAFTDASPYNYGTVNAGYSSSHAFTLSNSGQTSATKITPSALGTSFTFTGGYPGNGGTCTKTLAAGSSCIMMITFSPTKTTNSSKTLNLSYFNGVSNQTVSMSLKGKGNGSAAEITSITPYTGPVTGGTKVTIVGNSFTSPATVTIGGSACTSVVVVNSTKITCFTPAHTDGAFSVVETDAGGTASLIDGYIYQDAPAISSISPNTGLNTGGTALTISGSDFLTGASVLIDGSSCGSIQVISGDTIQCTAPAHASGYVNIVVTNTDGQSVNASNAFLYQGAWTWKSGSTTADTSTSTNPGGRDSAASWTDTSNNFWMFGGWGIDSGGNVGRLNDLWKFNGTSWTRLSSSTAVNQKGIYGTLGVANAANQPGARLNAVAWVDSNNNFWLFGGSGYDSAGAVGNLNDLWKFNGTQWAWMGGSNLRNSMGSYGTQGMTAASNMPSARLLTAHWIDSSYRFWLFGGFGSDSQGNKGDLNDLWVFDGTNWTWVGGSSTRNQVGSYGSLGVSNASNQPSARDSAYTWTDNSGKFWMFGGAGIDSLGLGGDLNDLWMFDGTYWTWKGGSTVSETGSTYGTQGLASASNAPGARDSGVTWVDSYGNLWMFGGYGIDSVGVTGELNDLWKFDGAQWTWLAGDIQADSPGVFGTLGTASLLNFPGARQYSSAWIDSSNRLWLFGGFGWDGSGNMGELNDMWMFKP